MTIEQMKMPQLGESVTEGTISKWLVKPGDSVNKYEAIAEVMTDKVNAEIPSSFTGVIKELKAAEDETLAVGEVICSIEVEGSETQANETIHSEDKGEDTTQVVAGDVRISKARYYPAVLKI